MNIHKKKLEFALTVIKMIRKDRNIFQAILSMRPESSCASLT